MSTARVERRVPHIGRARVAGVIGAALLFDRAAVAAYAG